MALPADASPKLAGEDKVSRVGGREVVVVVVLVVLVVSAKHTDAGRVGGDGDGWVLGDGGVEGVDGDGDGFFGEEGWGNSSQFRVNLSQNTLSAATLEQRKRMADEDAMSGGSMTAGKPQLHPQQTLKHAPKTKPPTRAWMSAALRGPMAQPTPSTAASQATQGAQARCLSNRVLQRGAGETSRS
ncbi:unnamed protein product [Arctogadus glacialis]